MAEVLLHSIADMAEQERSLTVKAAERVRGAGFKVPDVSVGSTPTALMARSLDGVTELRAGVYATFDLVMAGLGVCAIETKPVRRGEEVAFEDHIALSLTINHQVVDGWDAGVFLRDLCQAIENFDLLLAQG